MLSRCNGSQGVELVVHPGERPLHMACGLAVVQHFKIMRLTRGREVTHRRAEAAHLAPATLVQHTRQAFFQAIHHHAA